MANEVKVELGQRRLEDVALDLLYFVVSRQAGNDQPNTADAVFELYDKCVAAVRRED
jgi:hypothetical protein